MEGKLRQCLINNGVKKSTIDTLLKEELNSFAKISEASVDAALLKAIGLTGGQILNLRSGVNKFKNLKDTGHQHANMDQATANGAQLDDNEKDTGHQHANMDQATANGAQLDDNEEDTGHQHANVDQAAANGAQLDDNEKDTGHQHANVDQAAANGEQLDDNEEPEIIDCKHEIKVQDVLKLKKKVSGRLFDATMDLLYSVQPWVFQNAEIVIASDPVYILYAGGKGNKYGVYQDKDGKGAFKERSSTWRKWLSDKANWAARNASTFKDALLKVMGFGGSVLQAIKFW